ncbi:MAG: ABC transporter ATP-binding protein [Anaerolineae bacterium]
MTKRYGGQVVLRDVSLAVEAGQILCLLGPSGSGKSTLLRIVAGLEQAEAGHISFDGRPLAGVPVHRRDFGLMFQDYALFPHKDVAANVAFGLRMAGWSRDQIEARVAEMLDLVGLAGYESRQVFDLSGGEQQRVALARSLAPGPRLLMLDEPLGSLDRALREELMIELRTILKDQAVREGVTAIYVTHDQEEAFALADRVVILDRGRIVQQGAPQAVYRHPASAWVARFLGLSNLVPGRVINRQPLQVTCPLGRLTLPGEEPGPGVEEVTLLLRPEAARLAGDSSPEGLVVEGTVQRCSFRGSHYRLEIRHEAGLDLSFELFLKEGRLPRRGQTVRLALRPGAISLLPEVERERDDA